MTFLTHAPPAPLRPAVAQAVGYRVPANPTGLHRGLPSRHLTLVVELPAPLRVTGGAGAVAAHGVVGGLDTRPAFIDASRPQEGIQYALTPFGARALLGVSAAELAGHVVDLADLFGARAGDLVEQVRRAAGWAERFAVLDAALLRRLCAAPRPAQVPAEVARAWQLIFASQGPARVAAVAADIGWSRRHLAARFRQATGLTPKQAVRVARFEAARGLLLAPSRPALAAVATGCGYADQSHLAREWRAMAGCSVGAWLREEFPFVHDTTAADQGGWPA
ncbi:MAG TPA: helix-turn-helix domain-containing protein [Pilimelia sp.]|nr:helix-turn-helix domain-containing protein [Pilimelia sp.]